MSLSTDLKTIPVQVTAISTVVIEPEKTSIDITTEKTTNTTPLKNRTKTKRGNSDATGNPFANLRIDSTKDDKDTNAISGKSLANDRRILEARTKKLEDCERQLKEHTEKLVELFKKLETAENQDKDAIKTDIKKEQELITSLSRESKDELQLPPGPPSGPPSAFKPVATTSQNSKELAERLAAKEKELEISIIGNRSQTIANEVLNDVKTAALKELQDVTKKQEAIKEEMDRTKEKIDQNNLITSDKVDAVQKFTGKPKDVIEKDLAQRVKTHEGRKLRHDELHANLMKVQIRGEQIIQRTEQIAIQQECISWLEHVSTEITTWNRDLKEWSGDLNAKDATALDKFKTRYEQIGRLWGQIEQAAASQVEALRTKIKEGSPEKVASHFHNPSQKDSPLPFFTPSVEAEVRKEFEERTKAMDTNRKELHDKIATLWTSLPIELSLMAHQLQRNGLELNQMAALKDLSEKHKAFASALEMWKPILKETPNSENHKGNRNTYDVMFMKDYTKMSGEWEKLKSDVKSQIDVLVNVIKSTGTEKTKERRFDLYDKDRDTSLQSGLQEKIKTMQEDREVLKTNLTEQMNQVYLDLELKTTISLDAINEKFALIETYLKVYAPMDLLRGKLSSLESSIDDLKIKMRAYPNNNYDTEHSPKASAYETLGKEAFKLIQNATAEIDKLKSLINEQDPEKMFTSRSSKWELSTSKMKEETRQLFIELAKATNLDREDLRRELDTICKGLKTKFDTIAVTINRMADGVRNKNQIPYQTGYTFVNAITSLFVSAPQYYVTSPFVQKSVTPVPKEEEQKAVTGTAQ